MALWQLHEERQDLAILSLFILPISMKIQLANRLRIIILVLVKSLIYFFWDKNTYLILVSFVFDGLSWIDCFNLNKHIDLKNYTNIG